MTSSHQSQTGPQASEQSSHPSSQQWQQARTVGRQRLSRIGGILKSATQEAASELRTGTAELDDLGRGALDRWIAEQKGGSVPSPEQPARSWKPLLSDLGGVVRERKSDWLQQLAARLASDLSPFDTDMSQRYGDRYQRWRRPLSWLQSQLNRYGTQPPSSRSADTQSVDVEVLSSESPEL